MKALLFVMMFAVAMTAGAADLRLFAGQGVAATGGGQTSSSASGAGAALFGLSFGANQSQSGNQSVAATTITSQGVVAEQMGTGGSSSVSVGGSLGLAAGGGTGSADQGSFGFAAGNYGALGIGVNP